MLSTNDKHCRCVYFYDHMHVFEQVSYFEAEAFIGCLGEATGAIFDSWYSWITLPFFIALRGTAILELLSFGKQVKIEFFQLSLKFKMRIH